MRPSFKKSRLDNGMVLVTESLPQFQSLSLGVWVSAGTRHEAPGEAGMSHFLEHMMFKGTEKRSALDIALAVDRVGGEFNAFTSREYTCFHLLLLARDIKLAAEIMSDVLMSSTFANEEIERERKVILQEISMVEDNPEEHLHDLFFEQAYGGHPLGKPILGDPKVIEKFDRDTVFSYFRRHYSPRQIVISVAGDVSHEEVKRHLNRYLRPSRSGTSQEARGQRKLGSARPRIHPGTWHLRRDLEQSHVIVGFPGVSNGHAERFSAFLMNIYVGGGMSSALFQEIREKRGLAYTIYSSLAPFSDSGLFSVYVGTSPNEVATCLEIVGRELAKLRRRPLEKRALEVLKDNLKGTILLNCDSVENRMTAIAKNEMFFGRYYSPREATKMIDRVTPESLQAIARKLIDPKKMIVTVLGPAKSSGGTTRAFGRKLLKEFQD